MADRIGHGEAESQRNAEKADADLRKTPISPSSAPPRGVYEESGRSDGRHRVSRCAACGVIAIIQAYFFSQSAKASAKARYPGRPFSMARMARLPLT